MPTFSHWKTKEVDLKVCTQDSFVDTGEAEEESLLLNCVDVPADAAGKPVTIELPPGNEFDVSIY